MGISFTANKSITMISARSCLFAAFVAMFAMTMAAPDAEPKAEAEAEPAYYYGGAQNGPHSYYYKGYNGHNGHRAHSGFNGQQGFNGHSGHYNQYHYNYPSTSYGYQAAHYAHY